MVGETGRCAKQHIENAGVRCREKEMATTRSANCGHEARGLRCVAESYADVDQPVNDRCKVIKVDERIHASCGTVINRSSFEFPRKIRDLSFQGVCPGLYEPVIGIESADELLDSGITQFFFLSRAITKPCSIECLVNLFGGSSRRSLESIESIDDAALMSARITHVFNLLKRVVSVEHLSIAPPLCAKAVEAEKGAKGNHLDKYPDGHVVEILFREASAVDVKAWPIWVASSLKLRPYRGTVLWRKLGKEVLDGFVTVLFRHLGDGRKNSHAGGILHFERDVKKNLAQLPVKLVQGDEIGEREVDVLALVWPLKMLGEQLAVGAQVQEAPVRCQACAGKSSLAFAEPNATSAQVFDLFGNRELGLVVGWTSGFHRLPPRRRRTKVRTMNYIRYR